jgi:small-conductance mechanosensitive channel
LENRIAALEKGAAFDATKTAVQQVEAECLMKLREIRAALVAEQQQASNSSSTINGATAVPGAAASNNKELQQLQSENAELKRKLAKLEYRVQHVVSEMDVMYEKYKAACIDTRASF